MTKIPGNKYLFSANIDETEEQIKTAIYKEFIQEAKIYKELDDLLILVKGLELIEEQKIELKFKDKVYIIILVISSDQPEEYHINQK